MDRFDYLKLASVSVYVKTQRIEVELLFPESKQDEINEHSRYIINSVRKVIDSNAQVDVSFRKSHFDIDFFRKEVIAFFEDYPSIKPLINVDRLSLVKNSDTVELMFELDSSAYDYIIQKQIDKKLASLTDISYCEKVIIEYKPMSTEVDLTTLGKTVEEKPAYALEKDCGRFIVPENVDSLFGAPIYEPALYISDCTKADTDVIICGTISELQELRKKPKEDGTEGGVFYKFTLSDYTGNIKCLIFPNKRNSDKLSFIKNGQTVVLTGSTKQSTFRGATTIDVFVKDVSICTLPNDFEENKLVMLVPDEYKTVFPQPYVEKTQVGLFGQDQEYIPQMLMGRKFVLFDLETTDKEPLNAKIIEIAGALIENGKITQTFSTFVNPQMHIPERITGLTSIKDEDVVNAPTIDLALPDFYKFTDGAVLVGHNINGFDIPILNYRGEDLKIRFLNESIDTYVLAQKYLKGKGLKNLKLGTIAEYYGFSNEHAHRADSDIIANYKMFLGMCIDIEKLGESI